MSSLPLPKRSSRQSLSTKLPSQGGPSEPLALRMPGGKGKGRAASIGPTEFASRGLGKPLSPKTIARRALVPRKSILKPYNSEETINYTQAAGTIREDEEDEDEDEDENETQFRSMPGESTTMRILRRVSFAAHAHVRMFETATVNPLSQSQGSTTSSQGSLPPPSPAPTTNLFEEPSPQPPPSITPASSSSRRRSSLNPQSSTAVPPKRSRRSSVAEFGSDGSADMSMEDDSGEDDDFFRSNQLDQPGSLFDETPDNFLGEELDFTQVHGAILPPSSMADRALSPSASTISPPSSPSNPVGNTEEEGGEEQTLDFTVATGGIIPSYPPEFAVESKGSVGYRTDIEEAERLNGGDEVEGDLMDMEEEENGMEMTGVVGGIFRREEEEQDETERSPKVDRGVEDGMEMTEAGGGIFTEDDTGMSSELNERAEDEGEMDETVAFGGLLAPTSIFAEEAGEDEDGEAMEMEETVALGGVLAPRSVGEEDETADGEVDFTVAQGGIFQSAAPSPPPPLPSSLFSEPSKQSPAHPPSVPSKSPRKSSAHVPTRPRESSLSRPTFSSILKAKPNLFDSPKKPSSAPSPAEIRPVPTFVNSTLNKANLKRRVSHIDGGRDTEEGSQRAMKRRASSATAGGGVFAPSEGIKARDVFGLYTPSTAVGALATKVVEQASSATTEVPDTARPEVVGGYIVDDIIERSEENPPSPIKQSPARGLLDRNPFELSPVLDIIDGLSNKVQRNLFEREDSPIAHSATPPVEALVFPLDSQEPKPQTTLSPSRPPQTYQLDIFNSPPSDVVPQPSIFDFFEPTSPPLPAAPVEEDLLSIVPPGPPSPVRVPSRDPPVPVSNTPRKRIGRPSLAVGASKGKRPEENSNEVEDVAIPEVPSQLSLTQFLELANLNWREKMSAGKRRSTIRPGEMLGIHRFNAESTTRSNAGGEYLTMDYANHVLNLPYLIVYQWACNHLKDSTSQSQKNVQVLDEEASSRNPVLFTEYLEADDQEKVLIEGQLKYLKVFAQHTVKNKWRIWRMDLVDELKASHEEDLSQLQQDRARLQEIKKSFQETVSLTELKARHATLKAQLAEEKAKVDQVLACDPEVLSHRRAEVKEQKGQIDSLKADLNDTNNVLASLHSKAAALQTQKEACMKVIDYAVEYFSGSNVSSKEKVFKLKDEFDKVQELHSVSLTSRQPTFLTVMILRDLEVSLNCHHDRPLTSGASLRLVSDAGRLPRRNGVLIQVLFELVKVAVDASKFSKASQLFQHIYQLWSSSVRIAQEFHLISIRYPVTYTILPGSTTVQAQVTMLIPSAKAKAKATFAITPQALLSWPSFIKQLPVDVEVCYGRQVDRTLLNKTIQERLATATQETPTGILVDACLEAVASYNHDP